MGRNAKQREDYSAEIAYLGRLTRIVLSDDRRPMSWRQDVAQNLQEARDKFEEDFRRQQEAKARQAQQAARKAG